MKKKYPILSWLILNLALLIISMLTPWFIFGFEPQPVLKSILDSNFFFKQITVSIKLLLDYGFAWLWILSLLQGVGGVFVMGYVVLKIINIAKLESHTGNKILSIVLVFVLVISIVHELVYGLRNLPLGYLLFMLGVFSSAVFEWRNSMTDNDMTGK